SVCTTCGYCETSCAEKDTLKVYRDGMELKNSYFEYKTLAKDELFKCVECGKEFATAKSVQKIANTLKPLFASNPVKLRTLYCCAECKAKLMLKEQIEKGEFDE
ncbi:ferredoxin, partial [Campylobacter novaezeelandiae]|nr:ferredoxin [Campylobacter novaezeelandiae]